MNKKHPLGGCDMTDKEKLNGSLQRLAVAFGDVLREAVDEAVAPVKVDMAQLRQALEVTDGNVLELKKDVSELRKDLSKMRDGQEGLMTDIRDALNSIKP